MYNLITRRLVAKMYRKLSLSCVIRLTQRLSRSHMLALAVKLTALPSIVNLIELILYFAYECLTYDDDQVDFRIEVFSFIWSYGP